ncbi:DEAD/DEAH box helicase [Pedobacter xixiisoli]|uniref:Superfamily II DNA or RNA helicase, SNF2 family n=1 Tax=Pedobacter xixiisoli TaxID=1476464 RepID=A0A285ZRX5_9SPHI|nr:DEAD/DEAH box helicase [Pedobacter xixiisoli]SOD12375.1 Superfamily II DNA or RNA helicase, SNF2 family [Pedobacter xixiisoli]
MQEREDDIKLELNYDKLLPVIKKGNSKRLTPQIHPANLVLVFSRHRHYRHLVIELVSAEQTKHGKLKNPLQVVDPLDLIWKTEDQQELKFFAAVSKFKNHYQESQAVSDVEALKAIVVNPLKLPVYLHDEKVSASVNASSVVGIDLSVLKPDFELNVDERADQFAIEGVLHLNGKSFALETVELRYQYFVQIKQQLYLVKDPFFLSLIDFFKQHRNQLVLERELYEDFQENILEALEEKVKINYSFLKPATKNQMVEQGFDLENEQLIYLTESEDYVLLTPVMRYGALEIPIISQKQIKAKDKRGQMFTLQRDAERELQFITDIAKMHPYFEEQAVEFSEQRHADCFYMHRKHFLSPEWFLEAFEAWRSKGIAILGFNGLKDNRLSPFKANIAIHVISGIDWFETAIKVQFNKQTVSLKHLHKSIRNKSKFVPLDDGTIGILPDEWLKKFEGYFGAAEISEETLHTPNINYSAVEELYEEALLSIDAKERLQLYRSKLASFEHIDQTEVPSTLNTTLRGYQKEGLNWLNFLDTFNFGGCLADDMGLGKTIQILAFILSQQEKVDRNTNLIVVPASLVFNWQQEIKKFAPTLKVTTIYGANRVKQLKGFDKYQVVLTSYGTLLADVAWLKEYHFNYIFLDESQLIKNPDSQRYKAVRLLQSRNKVVLTGTPIENNTFDLYGQLSFACTGLLGNREHFRQQYSVPIDQFNDAKRAEELQQRIKPFILRRTKAQVAQELPDKTEMVIYCEMGQKQREIYESCRNEIRDYLMGRSEDELTKSSMHVLQGITKLRQICNSPALLSKETFYDNASAKMDVLLEQIESKAPYHKILVFSQFVGMLNLVKEALEERNIRFVYLSGQTKNREAVVNSFQQDEEMRVFLISLKAGGVGLNLTEADYVFLIDPWWNPAVENQAIDRTYRIGQHKNVMAVRLICPDTIEEKIMLMQEKKKELVTDLIKTETSIFKSLSKDDLLRLI